MNGLPIVNPRSGRGGPKEEELAAEMKRLGIAVHELREGEDPGAVAQMDVIADGERRSRASAPGRRC